MKKRKRNFRDNEKIHLPATFSTVIRHCWHPPPMLSFQHRNLVMWHTHTHTTDRHYYFGPYQPPFFSFSLSLKLLCVCAIVYWTSDSVVSSIVLWPHCRYLIDLFLFLAGHPCGCCCFCCCCFCCQLLWIFRNHLWRSDERPKKKKSISPEIFCFVLASVCCCCWLSRNFSLVHLCRRRKARVNGYCNRGWMVIFSYSRGHVPIHCSTHTQTRFLCCFCSCLCFLILSFFFVFDTLTELILPFVLFYFPLR